MRGRAGRQLTIAGVALVAGFAFWFFRGSELPTDRPASSTPEPRPVVAAIDPDPADSPSRSGSRSSQDPLEVADSAIPDTEYIELGDSGIRTERTGPDTDKLELNRVAPIILNELTLAPGAASVELSGRDPLAPRELLAWRVKKGRRAVIARGSSDRKGDIHFPPLIAPRDGLEVVVTAADAAPGLPGASLSETLPGRLPSAPYAEIVGRYESQYEVHIVPNEASGDVLLADPEGQVFAQYRVARTPIASARSLDVTLDLRRDDTFVLVAHEFSDGRRSDWRVIELPLDVDAKVD